MDSETGTSPDTRGASAGRGPATASAPRRGIAAFLAGLSLPWQGLRFMNRHPGLWTYAWAPVALNTLITGLVAGGLVFSLWHLYGWIFPNPPEAWWWNVLVVLGALAVGVLALGVAVALAIALSFVLCAYYYGRLARAVERKLGTAESELTELSLWVEAYEGVRAAVEIALVSGALFLVSLVPAAGPVVAATVGWAVNSYLLGAEFFDYPLALRGWKRRRRRRYTRHYRGYTMGVGSVVFLLNMVPVLGAFVLTTAVVGTTLAYHRLGEPSAEPR